MDKIVLVGAGGHCKVIIDIINSAYLKEIVGITDKSFIDGNDSILEYPVLGNDDILPELFKNGVSDAFVCVGALGNIEVRDRIFYKLKQIGFTIPSLVHKNACVSQYAEVSEGTCFMAGAVVNPGTVIGENCIINTCAVIEHDCVIGRNTHISPNACVAGGVIIGEGCHIGMGSNVIQGISIGDNVTIGAGAVVISDIPSNSTAVGIPAKLIECR